MNAKRLLKLADFLETVPKDNFDMGVVYEDEGMFAGDCAPKYPRPKKHCGTVACAMGWATAIPSFRRAGLRLYETGSIVLKNSRCDGVFWCDSFDTAELFFELGSDESRFLFGGSEYGSTPKQVAKHIRKFVKKGGMYTP